MDNNQNNSNKNNQRRPGGFFTGMIFFTLVVLFIIWMFRFFKNDSSSEITYNEFLKMIDEQKIESVVIQADTIKITPIEEKKSGVSNVFFGSSPKALYTGKVEEDETLTNRLIEKGIVVNGEIPDNSAPVWYFIFS